MAALAERDEVIKSVCGLVVAVEGTARLEMVNVEQGFGLLYSAVLASIPVTLSSKSGLMGPVRTVIRFSTPTECAVLVGVETDVFVPAAQRAEPSAG